MGWVVGCGGGGGFEEARAWIDISRHLERYARDACMDPPADRDKKRATKRMHSYKNTTYSIKFVLQSLHVAGKCYFQPVVSALDKIDQFEQSGPVVDGA